MSDTFDDQAFGELAAELDGLVDPDRSRRRAIIGALIFSVGVLLLIASFVVTVWLGVLGFAVMVPGALLMAPHLSLIGASMQPSLRRLRPPTGFVPKKPR